MRQALMAVFHTSSFGLLIKPPEEDSSRIGQTFSSHTGRTSGLPFCSVMFGIHRLPRRRKTPVVRYSKNARCEPVSQLLTLFRRRPKPRCPSCHKWNRVYLTGGSFLSQ